jgi:hypothetical protein
MTTEKPSVELAGWAQSEHRALAALFNLVRGHLGRAHERPTAEWLSGLRAAMERFETHLRQNFATQESGGYLEALLHQSPALARQSERIRTEHAQLLRLAGQIRRDLAEVRPDTPLLALDAVQRVGRLLDAVAQHEQRENLIALIVFNQEIGGGD